MGIFDNYQADAWPIAFEGRLVVGALTGGVPMDPKVIKTWIKTKTRNTRSDVEVAKLIADTMTQMGISEDEAITKAADEGLMGGMNGFKRDEHGLFIEGRLLKAALKEAVSVAAASGKLELRGWGQTRKFVTSYFPEHVFVDQDILYIYRDGQHVTEHDGVNQKFIHTFRGDSVGYEQYVKNAEISFTIRTDHNFTKKDWAVIWLTGEKQGLGSSRSQGFGTYEVTQWDKILDARKSKGIEDS